MAYDEIAEQVLLDLSRVQREAIEKLLANETTEQDDDL